jgi:transcriptional regulator with XRE-family HTH domain
VNTPAGRVIAAARQTAGVSQAELARRLGVPAQSVSRLEHDVHSPSVRTLEKVAEALGMELRVRFVRQRRNGQAPGRRGG